MADDVTLKDDIIPPIQEELFRLYSQGYVTDITLTCEDGKIFEAHKVILSARSSYFYNLIPKLKGDPVIFLKGVKGTYLEKILKYVYSGSAVVPRAQLRSLFEVARSLQIKGLTELSLGELGKSLVVGGGGPGCGAKNMTLSPSGSSTKSDPDSYRYSQAAREAREIALKQQQKLYDKFSSNSYKNKSTAKSIQTDNLKTPTKKTKPLAKDLENNDEESFTFKYKHISDDSDDVDNDDANDSDFDAGSKPGGGAGGGAAGKFARRKRGRPSKQEAKVSRKLSKSSSEGETDSSDETNDDPSKRDDFSNSSESDSDSDNSDLDTDDSESVGKSPSKMRRDYSRLKKEPSPSLDDYYDAPAAKRTYRRQIKGPAVNGQQVLTVQCKGKRAELHLNKFCNGSKGKSILFKNQWMTPDDYEKSCGGKSKKYLDSITTDYGPLKTLTASGFLKPHAKKCRCNICSEDEPDGQGLTKRPKTSSPARLEETKTANTAAKNNDLAKESPVAGSGDQEPVNSPQKRKKAESVDTSKKPKIQQQDDKVMKEPVPSTSNSITSHHHHHEDVKPKPEKHDIKEELKVKTSMAAVVSSSPVKSQQTYKTGGEILSPPTLTTTKSTSSTPLSLNSNSSTFSTSSTDSLSPTFLSLTSTSSQISPKPTTALGSSMVPFPSKLSGIPSPNTTTTTAIISTVQQKTSTATATYSTPTTSYNLPAASSQQQQHSPALSQLKTEAKQPPNNNIQSSQSPGSGGGGNVKPHIAIQMGPPKLESTPIMAAGLSIGQTPQAFHIQQRSRLGAVMQVRCKAVSAYLYTNKYESGSKGKCILLGEEWLTPNEFEEKSGSKAKKYLSSIKCLGRPLRAFVNTGELRGSGPPPTPKPPRMTKPKPPQPIAPAPAPGQTPGQLNMAQISMPPPPPGMSPAAAHLSQSFTPVAMMGSVSVGGGGQPILINQSSFSVAPNSSLASSAAGGGMNQAAAAGSQLGTPILAPMTFTLAPMSAGMDGRQGIGVQQQMHGGQHM